MKVFNGSIQKQKFIKNTVYSDKSNWMHYCDFGLKYKIQFDIVLSSFAS